MNIKNRDVGRQCLVQYTDIGRVEGVIVDMDSRNKSCKVFEFSDRVLRNVDMSQIVELGKMIQPNTVS